MSRLRRYRVQAGETTLGAVNGLYFDDEDWAIRLVTLRPKDGSWDGPSPGTESRMVSPLQVQEVDDESECVRTSVAPAKVDEVPEAGNAPVLSPVTVQRTMDHFDLPPYWNGSAVWGDFDTPQQLFQERGEPGSAPRAHAAGSEPAPLYRHDPLLGLIVDSPDAALGQISDLLLDLHSWRIRYLIVWPEAPDDGFEVLLSPYWVSGPPHRSRITVAMTTETILSGPAFKPEELTEKDEALLARYYGFLKN